MAIYSSTQETAIGLITITADEHFVVRVEFGQSSACRRLSCNRVVDMAFLQLAEYLSGKRKAFDLPLRASGTDFQQKTWKALLLITYGETRSYKTIAENIGNPNACRAVGNANNKNPIPIFIPCHRVIGSNGSLVGYAGGIDIKEKLLKIEKNNINNLRKLQHSWYAF